MKFAPNSEAAYSVASWLDDRAQQGQYSRSSKLSPVADANITVEISTVSTPGEMTLSGPCSDPSNCTPGGTGLPLTGTEGEKITITDCISTSYTETVVYQYTCDAKGCRWVEISYALKVNKSITCGDV
jgi:hypothetical protein